MPWLKPNSLREISSPPTARRVAVHSSYSAPPEMKNPKSFQIIHFFVCLCHFLVFNSPSNSFFVIYFPASGWDVAYLHYAQQFGDTSEKGGGGVIVGWWRSLQWWGGGVCKLRNIMLWAIILWAWLVAGLLITRKRPHTVSLHKPGPSKKTATGARCRL